jgi:hypothetical protein
VDEGCWGPGTVFVYAFDGVLGGGDVWVWVEGVGREGLGWWRMTEMGIGGLEVSV